MPLIDAVVLSAASGATAPPARPRTAVATRIERPIVVDGVLDDLAWSTAVPIGDLWQRDPREGEPSTERTEIRLLYDRDNLYVGVICEDSQPHLVIGTQMARDAELVADDRIELLFDTLHDHRAGNRQKAAMRMSLLTEAPTRDAMYSKRKLPVR